ncbi:PD-(D/E)XK nuclease family protein [Neobacillus drentensis]|uniref:PD-(D/E)XK nuclease family protein n=1 Tax=Neobacillus drentensis TaxID=220684 RepID=UPI002FFEB392
MNIILGYWLDSAAYPDALGNKEASVGKVVTGFNGLVGILETQLGLTSPRKSENIRISEWQELIGKLDTGKKLFSHSFKTDSWNTARELLRRRDELVLAGWDPAVHVGGSKWIDTLAQLELASPNKTWGFPDRLRALMKRLKEQGQLHIDTITIVDEDETLWDPWSMELVSLLKKQGVQVFKEPVSVEQPIPQNRSSDLSLLQSVLAGETAAKEAQGDGSLLLVRSEQEWDAADYFISWMQEKGTEDTVLIKGEGALFLDEMLHRRGIPAVGVDTPSKWRAVLQVLPLTIDTYWKPLRVDRMMELLTIPGSPIPGKIRYKLANELAAFPGIGGANWLQAIESGIRDYEELWAAEAIEQQELKKRRKNLEDKLDLWVHHDYYEPNEGIPFETLVQICQKVAQWAAVQYQLTNDLMYTQAVQVAQEVIEGIKTLSVSQVTHLQVARILDSVLGEGATLFNYRQEASKCQVVSHPGQIWGHAGTILWWGFHKNTAGPSIRTWTSKERAWLHDHGFHLTEDDISRRREAASWQRAARLANKRLILFAPSKVKGAEIPLHPLWDEIRYAVARNTRTEKKITIEAAELRKYPVHPPFGETGERVKLSESSIPEPIRTWRVPENIVLRRQEESATSFESLIGCPLKWTFRYAANVRPGNVLSIPNESIMLGNLGHYVLEQLITEKLSWTEDEVRLRAGELYDQLTPMLAAPLLEPKNAVRRNETRLSLQKSLQKFFRVVNQAGIQIEHTELELQKTWNSEVEFKGRLDLVGKTQNGNKILLDAKWSKRPKNYKAKLENLSVQLALYHWLLSDQENEELPVAYFMLSTGDFFSRPHDDFPTDYHVIGPSLLESFEVLRKAVEDVSSQLLKGTVMAPGVPIKANKIGEIPDGQEQNEDPFVSTIDPPCSFCEYHHLCGLRRVPK